MTIDKGDLKVDLEKSSGKSLSELIPDPVTREKVINYVEDRLYNIISKYERKLISRYEKKLERDVNKR